MTNTTRFPFQTFETINAHGYSMQGEFIHCKVEFIRYLDKVTDTGFDCVVESGGIKSYSNSIEMWRDGEDVTPNAAEARVNSSAHEIDLPVAEDYEVMVDMLHDLFVTGLQEGSELARYSSGSPVTVVSTQRAPDMFRLREDSTNSYFDVSRESMKHYGWRTSQDSV